MSDLSTVAVGENGQQLLQEILTTCTDPLQAIEQFQKDNCVLLPSLTPTLCMLDLLNIPRSTFTSNTIEKLQNRMIIQITALSEAQDYATIKELSRKFVTAISLPEIREALFHTIESLPLPRGTTKEVDTKVLKALCNADILKNAPIKVKQHVWLYKNEIFIKSVLDAPESPGVQFIKRYDDEVGQQLTKCTLSHKFSQLKCPQLVEILNSCGSSERLFKILIDTCLRRFEENAQISSLLVGSILFRNCKTLSIPDRMNLLETCLHRLLSWSRHIMVDTKKCGLKTTFGWILGSQNDGGAGDDVGDKDNNSDVDDDDDSNEYDSDPAILRDLSCGLIQQRLAPLFWCPVSLATIFLAVAFRIGNQAFKTNVFRHDDLLLFTTSFSTSSLFVGLAKQLSAKTGGDSSSTPTENRSEVDVNEEVDDPVVDVDQKIPWLDDACQVLVTRLWCDFINYCALLKLCLPSGAPSVLALIDECHTELMVTVKFCFKNKRWPLVFPIILLLVAFRTVLTHKISHLQEKRSSSVSGTTATDEEETPECADIGALLLHKLETLLIVDIVGTRDTESPDADDDKSSIPPYSKQRKTLFQSALASLLQHHMICAPSIKTTSTLISSKLRFSTNQQIFDVLSPQFVI